MDYYEGDLLTPKYEDPHGYAAGIKAPGGTIVRTDINGSFVELSPADFAIATAWPSIARAICSPPIPTWNGTKACPGIGQRASCT